MNHRNCLLFLIYCFIGGANSLGQSADEENLKQAATAEYRAGHFDKAETLLRDVLAASQRRRDKDATAAILNELGDLYLNEEHFAEAGQFYSRALSLFEQHPRHNLGVAITQRNVAALYYADGRLEDTLAILKEASKTLSADTNDHRAIAAGILSLEGIVNFRLGKISRAETLFSEATRMLSVASPEDDLTLSQILNNLALIYKQQRKYAKAEDCYKRSLEIEEQKLGSLSEVALTLASLGILYTQMGRFQDAENSFLRSLEITQQFTPAVAGRIVRTLHLLSTTYLQTGDKARAEETLAHAVQIARHNPSRDPEMAKVLDAYSDVLKSNGKTEEARTVRAEARRTRMAAALTVQAPKK